MKKLLCLLFVLLLTAAALPAAAAGVSLKITPSSAEVAAGQNVTFTVRLSGSGKITSGSIEVSFDDGLELVSGKFLRSDSTMASFFKENRNGAVAFSEAADLSGDYFTFVLKAKTVSASAKNVRVRAVLKNGDTDVGTVEGSASVKIVCASHNYGGWTKNANDHQRTCSVCGHVEKAAHKWDGGKVTKAATCKENGTKTFTCTVCGATKTENIAKTDSHTIAKRTVTKQPTCTESGIEEGVCSVCGKTVKNTIKATGHKFGAWASVKAATCTESGTEERKCSVCGAAESRTVKAPGHDLEQTKTVKEPTADAPGLKEGRCKRCGQTVSEEIPPLTASTASTAPAGEPSAPVSEPAADPTIAPEPSVTAPSDASAQGGSLWMIVAIIAIVIAVGEAVALAVLIGKKKKEA